MEKLILGAKLASLPSSTHGALLSNPRGLDRILDALAAPVPPTVAEQERWDRDNDGDRFE